MHLQRGCERRDTGRTRRELDVRVIESAKCYRIDYTGSCFFFFAVSTTTSRIE